MKTKHFYSHLVETTDITLEVAELNVSKEERVHLLSLADANIHTTVVKTVLDKLPEEEKKTFLSNMVSTDHRKTWQHLNSQIKNAENLVKQSINKAVKDLLIDLKEVKAK